MDLELNDALEEAIAKSTGKLTISVPDFEVVQDEEFVVIAFEEDFFYYMDLENYNKFKECMISLSAMVLQEE